jgi:hypothetical protein
MVRAHAVLLLLALGACEDPRRLPPLGRFNAHVLAVAASYPTDGTHRYHWPRAGTWKGNARTLRYGGEVIAEGDPEGRCHCSGLTFEVFFQAFERWCAAEGRPFRILDLDAAGVRRLQREWFGSPEDRATLHTALTRNGLGVRIADWEDARPGDFVQLWRHSGSGHAVVFRGWDRDSEGRIQGIRYWSTQGSTDGIGERSERFGEDGSAVKRDEFWLCRVGEPPPP